MPICCIWQQEKNNEKDPCNDACRHRNRGKSAASGDSLCRREDAEDLRNLPPVEPCPRIARRIDAQAHRATIVVPRLPLPRLRVARRRIDVQKLVRPQRHCAQVPEAQQRTEKHDDRQESHCPLPRRHREIHCYYMSPLYHRRHPLTSTKRTPLYHTEARCTPTVLLARRR